MSVHTLPERFPAVDVAVEVAVGQRPEVAAALADRGVDVTATDVVARAVPPAVEFVRDDLTAPDRSIYEDAALLYARNLPPELQRPLADLADAVGAACAFTTLGGDPAVLAVERETLPDDTLYWYRR